MGYSTDFVGDLLFTCSMTDEMWETLESYFGEDAREHSEWDVPRESYGSPKFYYIDIEPNDNRTGIMWNGAEKCYGMVEIIQFLMDEMRKTYPQFGLVGVMEAQGEDVQDHWFLVADGTVALSVDAREYYTKYESKLNEARKSISDDSSSIEATIS